MKLRRLMGVALESNNNLSTSSDTYGAVRKGKTADVRFVPQGDILRCGSSFATLAAILRASSCVSLVCHQV